MKECFYISKYVNIYHCDGNGTKGELLMEVQFRGRICTGKRLLVYSIEPASTEIDLGIVEAGQNYIRNRCIEIKTDKGWWHISYNENLTWLLGDPLEFMD